MDPQFMINRAQNIPSNSGYIKSCLNWLKANLNKVIINLFRIRPVVLLGNQSGQKEYHSQLSLV